MNIPRSSFYNWKMSLSNPSDRTKRLVSSIVMFEKYHLRYPSHGYRWLNAKILLDTGLVMSAPYAHKCCKIAGIKSEAKRCLYKKPGEPYRVYPNLLLAGMNVNGPMQCIVSDMTAFRVRGVYYELTLYMDIWNNEIMSHSLSSKRGDRMTYISGLNDLLEFMKVPGTENRAALGPGFCLFLKGLKERIPQYCAEISSTFGWSEPAENPDFLFRSPSLDHIIGNM